MKTITITIDKQGGTSIKTEGYTGEACKDATKHFEKALGLTVKDEATAEAFQDTVIDLTESEAQ